MKRVILIASMLMGLVVFNLQAQDKSIVQLAVGSEDHTTLVSALKAADLVSALQGDGPFTVFAPTNAAFEALPDGTLDMLLKPENKGKLASILKYHVVSGELNAEAVVSAIKSGYGKAKVETLEGGSLTVKMDGENVVLMDENGGKATVVQTDLMGKNGVIHVIDSVVLPK